MRFFLLLLGLIMHGLLQGQTSRFAVIGDYGWSGQPEADVANMVRSWNPNLVITVGDNNYDNGSASTIDVNIGQYYHQFISPYVGGYGQGDTVNRFFPALGNHDWVAAGAIPYLDYFTLPGNERYYDFVRGDVHFFSIDSDTHEPDGTTNSSVQGQWLQSRLATSTARWRIVYFHHPPYSSGTTHGSTTYMRWPFQQWGASVVLSGHEHIYERLVINNFPYIVNGLGGRSLYPFGTPLAGSEARYNANYGAMLVTATPDSMVFTCYSRTGLLVDRYTLRANPTGVKDKPTKDKGFNLEQNYPNPFNPSTGIGFHISHVGFVSLKVRDVLGREIEILVEETRHPGTYSVQWDATGRASGVYFYSLSTEATTQTRMMMLVR